MSGSGYHLVPRRAGTALFGASVPQVVLLGIGAGSVAIGPAVLGAGAGTVAGAGVLMLCLLLAFMRIGGEPLVHLLPVVIAFLIDTRGERGDGKKEANRPDLPGLPPSVELSTAPGRAGVSTRTGEAPGLILDRRNGTITAVLDVRGGPFGLLDGAGRDRRVVEWARVLTQFARETPVVHLGWTVQSGPGTAIAIPAQTLLRPGEAATSGARSRAKARSSAEQVRAYRQTLAEAAPFLARHDLRLWLTVRPMRGDRRADPRMIALAAADTLAARCGAAGLHVHAILSAADLHDTLLDHAIPPSLTSAGPGRGLDGSGVASFPGLAARAGLAAGAGAPPRRRLVPSGGFETQAFWDAMRIGATWHRVFWIAGWPTGTLHPGWLDPLLHEVPCVRTLAVAMRPVPWRASRRRINSETVSVDTAVHLRDRHAVRVPVGLAQAHDDIDRRDAELSAGYPEYAYLGLIDVAAPGRDELDDACAAIIDLAARCGIVDLRPLHGRHHRAWAATLPFGLVPRQSTTGAP
ncbi:SCO6880 family protein [Frankia canadensis]|uniref:SCO6880 family protein n=1 Tax=Frankia canadensis TaxID=1836972 RepID=UPI00311A9E5D